MLQNYLFWFFQRCSSPDEALSYSLYTEEFPAIQDAGISEAAPTINYNTRATIGTSADGRHYYLVQFDVSSLHGKTIDKAVLQFTTQGGSCWSSHLRYVCNRDIHVVAYPVTTSWNERIVAWNTAPQFDETKELEKIIVDDPIWNKNTMYEISSAELDDIVWQWAHDKDNNYGIVLMSTDETITYFNQKDVVIATKDQKTNPAAVQLVVTYH